MTMLLRIGLGATLAFVSAWLIAQVGLWLTSVPRDFPPFTALPILSGAVGGALLGGLAYGVVRAVSATPDKTFLFVAVVALALSFALPLRLSFTKSRRFAGVTPVAQIVMVLMHAAVATTTVGALLVRVD